ncbi:MAG: hypothetical protein IJ525_03100 [Alphaproteobacteria bacterium]|nr:hypothetical protein [Alphaproteobacteria bacterium]
MTKLKQLKGKNPLDVMQLEITYHKNLLEIYAYIISLLMKSSHISYENICDEIKKADCSDNEKKALLTTCSELFSNQ